MRRSGICIKSQPLDGRGKSNPSPAQTIHSPAASNKLSTGFYWQPREMVSFSTSCYNVLTYGQ